MSWYRCLCHGSRHTFTVSTSCGFLYPNSARETEPSTFVSNLAYLIGDKVTIGLYKNEGHFE